MGCKIREVVPRVIQERKTVDKTDRCITGRNRNSVFVKSVQNEWGRRRYRVGRKWLEG